MKSGILRPMVLRMEAMRVNSIGMAERRPEILVIGNVAMNGSLPALRIAPTGAPMERSTRSPLASFAQLIIYVGKALHLMHIGYYS